MNERTVERMVESIDWESLYKEEEKKVRDLQFKIQQMTTKMAGKSLEINALKAMLWDLKVAKPEEQ